MGLNAGCGVILSLFLAACGAGCSSHPSPSPVSAIPANAPATHPIYAMPLTSASTLAPSRDFNDPRDLKVMSFNLRVATAFDLWNTWEFRKPMVVERIRSFNPDILGTQEGLAGMEDYLRKQLSDYTFEGVGRNDGKRSGEMVGIFYKTARFNRLDGGHFWLSERPDKPGSHGWGAWFPRMVTWVKLQPTDGTPSFFWFNTHLDAFSNNARKESAKYLMSRMTAMAGSMPCILTGDFNADAGSKPYETFTTATTTTVSTNSTGYLADVFRLANPNPTRNEGTRHDFNGHKDGSRIDWILASPSFLAISANIDRTRGVLGYPSDHFPMTATLRPAAMRPMIPQSQRIATAR